MKPVCLVLAGPNGAGKSSLYKHLDAEGEFINADIIAAEMNPLNPETVAFPAGREAMARIEQNLNLGTSFVFETTLSGQQPIKMMKTARQAGYSVEFAFVALSSAEMHISRVAQRVSQGGHHIDSEVIRRRYITSFDNLVAALPLADEVAIFDNSQASGYRLCVSLAGGIISENFLRASRALDRRIAKCLQNGLGIPTADLWPK